MVVVLVVEVVDVVEGAGIVVAVIVVLRVGAAVFGIGAETKMKKKYIIMLLRTLHKLT